MAITNARMQMRRGLEADFDPDKMQPGEWAVSLDKKYVRMCFSVGVCVRMATYDSFEEDMAQIEEILSKCETIEEAVAKINTEVSANAKAVAEYTEQAKKYRDEAKAFRDEAESIAGIGVATKDKAGIVKPDGTTITVDEDGTIHANGSQGTIDYEELENKPQINGNELSGDKSLSELGIASATDLQKVEAKVDTIIEKAELNIKNSAKGENLHLTDSANSKAVEFGLYGKAEQKQYSGKNLLPNNAISQTINGVTFTVNIDSSVTLNGIATNDINNFYLNQGNINLDNMFATCDGIENLSGIYFAINNGIQTFNVYGTNKKVALNGTMNYARLYIDSGATFNNATIKPMISVEGGEYEPYVGGIASPNPEYPQDIEVAGSDGSVEVVSCGKNLLKNTATSQNVNGITFTLNYDGSVIANGTATETATLTLTSVLNTKETYVLSGCPSGGGNTKYRLFVKTDGKTYFSDEGSGITFSASTQIDYARIQISGGQTVNNLTFYPMISVEGGEYEPYTETTSTIPTPDGLCGIKVSSGGNYTDENGQQWICDEVVKYADGSGKRVQRIGVIDSYNGESVTTNYMSTTGQITTGAKVLYVLPELIVTDLTAEEIAEIEKLHTLYPITNISNDANCGMSIKYLCDSKNYIDNRLAQIEAVLINNI